MDILLTKVGTVGNLAMVERNANFSIFVQVALIKPTSKLNARYLFYFLQWDHMQKIINNNCSQSTIAEPEQEEQNQIATAIESVDKKIEIAQQTLILYQNLFKTLLHELMSGERRVNNL